MQDKNSLLYNVKIYEKLCRWRTEKNCIYMDALKLCNVTACLDSAKRLFHYFTPLNEKHFWPFAVLNSGNFKSVEVFRRI